MVDQRIILIRPCRQYHRESSGTGHFLKDGASRFFQFGVEGIFRPVCRFHGLSCHLFRDLEGRFHILSQLPVPVFLRIPVEQRGVIRDSPHLRRIVRVAHDNRISLYNRAHGLTCLFRVLGRNRRDRWHENPVHLFGRQISQVPVDKLCRKADCI